MAPGLPSLPGMPGPPGSPEAPGGPAGPTGPGWPGKRLGKPGEPGSKCRVIIINLADLGLMAMNMNFFSHITNKTFTNVNILAMPS